MVGDGREADPEVKNLNAKYVRLMTENKQTFAKYREARDEVRISHHTGKHRFHEAG